VTDIDKCVSACDCALNGTQISINIREQIHYAAHHSYHPRLVALFVQCKHDNEIQGATLLRRAFLASRVTAGPSTSSINADSASRFFSAEAAAAGRERTRCTN